MDKNNRITVQFNMDDPEQVTALKFIEKCGYKKNKIIAIMISEFISKYGLDPEALNKENIRNFISGYEYIKKYNKTAVPDENIKKQNEPISVIEVSVQQKGRKNIIFSKNEQPKQIGTVIDNEKADLALSAFGL